ncbi:MAG: hypothetical protein WCW64_03610 [Phycisphaerae bacterium]
MATAAVHRFYIIMWNLFDIGVAVFATDTCVGTFTEKFRIHIKQAIGAILIHTGKTSEAMTQQTVLCVRNGTLYCLNKVT